MKLDDATGFNVADEFRAYEDSQPTDAVEGGMWCIRSKQDVAKLKQHFCDVIEKPIQAPLEDFFALLNDLRALYCIDPNALQNESLESNEIYWVKAVIGFMEALLHVRESIAEIQPGIISTKLTGF